MVKILFLLTNVFFVLTQQEVISAGSIDRSKRCGGEGRR